ncbi:DNA polymerase III subunit alpha [Teratosphaeria destructans]|uniref:DNA polymerase III subunit alpha n=1 Tax=Teratosphaeria destructans TaxID=418781 RepID=A0A9W7SVI2_9PEZI|nr:DNA polymerase III subunit alpha [Teratosphaeria destructans]
MAPRAVLTSHEPCKFGQSQAFSTGPSRPLTGLHLINHVLIEQTTGLLVERGVDCDNVTLGEHLLKGVDTPAANLLLDLRPERLVVVVEELLAVEWLQSAEHPLTDTADGNGTHNLVLQVVLVLGDGCDVPLTAGDLLVSRDEVADEGKDGHDDVLGDRDDVGAGDLSDGDAAIGLVGGVQVDVVRANASGNGNLQVLGLGQALCGEVTRVEAMPLSEELAPPMLDCKG